MKRRLIKQGNGGYTLYLPKKWVEERGLSPGDELELSESRRGLLIHTSAEADKLEVWLNTSFRNKRFLEYAITDYYRAGYDRVVLPEGVTMEDLKRPLSLLRGFELGRNKERHVVEMVSELPEDKADRILKQMFFILKANIKYAVECIKDVKPIDLEFVEENSNRLIRHANIYMRSVSKKMSEFNGFCWSIVNLLHFTGRRVEFLAAELTDKKPLRLSREYIEYLEAVLRALDLLYAGIYKKSFESLMNIHEEHQHHSKVFKMLYADPRAYDMIVLTQFRYMYRNLLYASGAAIGVSAGICGGKKE